jgi:hypothetical protein
VRRLPALLRAMDVVKADIIRTATVVKANDSEEGPWIAFTLDSVVIGVDADGIETTAPVVVSVEHYRRPKTSASKSGRAPPKIAITALRALTEAVAFVSAVMSARGIVSHSVAAVVTEFKAATH